MIKIFPNFLLILFMFNTSTALADISALNRLPKESVKRAVTFHDLHKQHGSKLLILPNVWDPLSAKVFERANFKAIATVPVLLLVLDILMVSNCLKI